MLIVEEVFPSIDIHHMVGLLCVDYCTVLKNTLQVKCVCDKASIESEALGEFIIVDVNDLEEYQRKRISGGEIFVKRTFGFFAARKIISQYRSLEKIGIGKNLRKW